ncbi:MAG: hypothetical protein AB7F59_14350 [Bdellovibrionales bacterium]
MIEAGSISSKKNEPFRGEVMTFNPEQRLIIHELWLNKQTQRSAEEFVSSIAFIFREVEKIERSKKRPFLMAAKRVSKKNPTLSNKELFSESFRDQKFLLKFTESEERKDILYQLLIIQISRWLQKCCKLHVNSLSNRLGRDHKKWADKLLKIGPKQKNKFWAETIVIASNYVRHKEEWNFNILENDNLGNGVRRRENIVETIDHNLAKQNAKYLISLGVTQCALFGSFQDANAQILQLVSSDTITSLQANCEAWLQAVNTYVEYKLL